MSKIVLSELDYRPLAFYSAKWFLIWSFWFFSIGILAAVTLIAFLAACCREAAEKEQAH